ncbi:uncharacterized protein A4U43_C05F34800 [Asparagus officinalis]|uniref:Uncharacterized protein n=1 Tax=Asparagus officinalis TaxID=4686 RepID=A0A5P1EYK6_ASPOF|nr:uncharacterized protein A4U43_C05F34800 [Asparagus officinalis]
MTSSSAASSSLLGPHRLLVPKTPDPYRRFLRFRSQAVEVARDRHVDAGAVRLPAEYRKLRRVSDSDPKTKSRPRWYVLVFGSVRVPAAMEMKEIRIRQRRRARPAGEEKGGGGRGFRRSGARGSFSGR